MNTICVEFKNKEHVLKDLRRHCQQELQSTLYHWLSLQKENHPELDFTVWDSLESEFIEKLKS